MSNETSGEKKLENPILGETTQQIDIKHRDEFYQNALSLARQARHHILVFSHDLDHAVFDTQEIFQAFKELAISHRQANIQMLVQDIDPLTQKGHHLLDLSRRLSSHVAIRKTAKEHKDILETYMLVDTKGVLYRENPNRYEGWCNYYDPLHCKNLEKEFTQMWEHGVVDSALRQLSL